jgi:hypothetical protein
LAHCALTPTRPHHRGVVRHAAEDVERLSQALVTLGSELESLSRRVQALAAGVDGTEAAPRTGCPGGSCPGLQRHRAAIRAAVHTLERTRTSFKSKELGALRRTLEAVLFDETR